MAHSRNNVIVHGFSGKFGEMLVFRQKDGKTLATQAPGERTQPPSAKQQEVLDKFQRAVIYGKTVMADPMMKQAYKDKAGPGESAYNVAIADFFKAPNIDNVDLSGYTGQAGQQIKITVTDNFEVIAVSVSIENEDGTLQEEGDANQQNNKLEWIYTTSTTNSSLSGDKITITARDNPANVTKKEQTV